MPRGKSHTNLLELSRAQELVREQIAPASSRGPDRIEALSLTEAHGRILAAPIVAARELPSCDIAMMDGYAFAAGSSISGAPLRVVFEVAAGDAPAQRALAAGEAARIFTGAPLPPGADCVAMQEQCTREGDELRLQKPAQPHQHVRFRGEEMRAGAVILPAGRRLGPAELSLAAAAGSARVSVYRRPRVALLATGSELVPLGRDPAPGPGQIVETNSLALAEMCREAGAEPVLLGIARDSAAEIAALLAAADAEVLVTTAGASVGDHDHAEEAIGLLGGRLIFHGIAIRPGKPALFATLSSDKPRLIFALPGNPAAAMLCFELLVRPALLLLQGNPSWERPRARARLVQGSVSRVSGLTFFPRGEARYQDGELLFVPVAQQSSMQIGSWAAVNAVALIPPGEGRIEVGEMIDVLLLRMS